jgi:glucose/arabinose dehydrogenase
MRNKVTKTLSPALVMLAAICFGRLLMSAKNQSSPVAGAGNRACANDDSGLALPSGFCATVFADGIGHARDMVVAPNGVLYANTWSGRYYGNDTPPNGGFLVAMQDKNGSGRADGIERFGETVPTGGHGGTGIGIYKGAIYAEINDRIARYSSSGNGSIVPSGAAAMTIVSGLPLGGDHPMHPFLITGDGTMYVDVASATNFCQAKNRTPKSPGLDPCTASSWRPTSTKGNPQSG